MCCIVTITCELSSEMEFPEEQYFKLNRILLSIIGLWPYDNFQARYIRFILSLLIMISFTSTQVLSVIISFIISSSIFNIRFYIT